MITREISVQKAALRKFLMFFFGIGQPNLSFVCGIGSSVQLGHFELSLSSQEK